MWSDLDPYFENKGNDICSMFLNFCVIFTFLSIIVKKWADFRYFCLKKNGRTPVGVDFAFSQFFRPVRVNCGHLVVDFVTCGSRCWASDSQFRASGSLFFAFESRIYDLEVVLYACGCRFYVCRLSKKNKMYKFRTKSKQLMKNREFSPVLDVK